MAAVIIILECVNYKKKSIPSIVLYEERKWGEGTVYNSPGGNIDKGETAKEAAIRETKEEAFIDIPSSMLTEKNKVIVGKVHFWVVKLRSTGLLSREEYIKARFCTPGLKRYQKETHDITKVPITSFKRAILNKERYITDMGGRKLKLRKSFYDCLISDLRLVKKIEEVFRHHAC